MVEAGQILDRMETVIVGKRPVLELVLAAMLAGGHVLIEDRPGVAKTLLARTLARVFTLEFSRVQLTPDLLPSDLTGTGIWNEHERAFVFQPGPIFGQIVLADELNRATPRTQAGLLEAMEERAVTVDGVRHPLPAPFFVIATQNPIEQQGVFPLPEAQLDRFLIQVAMGYPGYEDEVRIVMDQAAGHPLDELKPVAGARDFAELAAAVQQVHTDDSVLGYLVRLARATRERDDLLLGASPRASLALHHMARTLAAIRGERFLRPDHVKAVAPAVLRHRLILTPQARLAGVAPDDIIEELLAEVEAPIYTG
ncbi:MAG TPA: MoxR family ATPase [Candidatus Sumerlaeota bacterium]|nr:MoxR family ATPase [Candidatus Sumerlaeota bacterium]HOR29236.1 MoxR family ATPase [Candidatus Sumerlaeota bacterium]HPK03162.1 MoxR family ATPase [Candidatus Sumerlaeota bacterium]